MNIMYVLIIGMCLLSFIAGSIAEILSNVKDFFAKILR